RTPVAVGGACEPGEPTFGMAVVRTLAHDSHAVGADAVRDGEGPVRKVDPQGGEKRVEVDLRAVPPPQPRPVECSRRADNADNHRPVATDATGEARGGPGRRRQGHHAGRTGPAERGPGASWFPPPPNRPSSGRRGYPASRRPGCACPRRVSS